MCPRCEGTGSVTDIDLTQLYDETQVTRRGRDHGPRLHRRRLGGAHLHRRRPGRGQADPRLLRAKELDLFLRQEPTKVKVENINMTYEGLIPKVQKSMLSKDREAMQPHIRAFVDRAVTYDLVSRVRRHATQRRRSIVEDPRDQHRRRLRDADQRPGGLGPGPRRTVGRAAARQPAAHSSTRSSRSGSATSRSTGPPARCPAARRSGRR